LLRLLAVGKHIRFFYIPVAGPPHILLSSMPVMAAIPVLLLLFLSMTGHEHMPVGTAFLALSESTLSLGAVHKHQIVVALLQTVLVTAKIEIVVIVERQVEV
jgi:hypothetical protein